MYYRLTLKLAKDSIKAVTNNSFWNIVATGASFIPGLGTAVRAGMAGAAALGCGMSLKDAAIAAARKSFPGPVAAAFDLAMGLAHGQRIDAAALDAARNQIPGGPLGRAGFDTALQAVKTKRSTRGARRPPGLRSIRPGRERA